MKMKLRAPAAVLGATFAFGILTACQDDGSNPLTAPDAAPQYSADGATPDPMNADPPVVASSHGAGVFIQNGTIQLGVNTAGALNVAGGTASVSGTTAVGLRYLPTNAEATAAGCLCEGWGVGDDVSKVWGGQNISVGGTSNIVVEEFTHDASTAKSVARVGSTFRVTHHYTPSDKTPNLYRVAVKIENISSNEVKVLYRRVMDWDIEPTPFNEHVTLRRGTAAAVWRTDNNGFNSNNVFSFSSYGQLNKDFTDVGPSDHGALFDFDFGTLAPGAVKEFNTFYGAAGNETNALAALGAVSAEAYSLGQTKTDPTNGTPNTFIFGFAGIGGEIVPELPPPPPPPPANAAPVASVGGPYSGVEASAVSFDGSASTDSDGTIASYAWDFGDGNTATGAKPSHTYGDNGSYTIKLTVTDDKGATHTASTTATISNVNPTGKFLSPLAINEGQSIELSVIDGSDVSAADRAAGFTYAFSCNSATVGAFGTSSSITCPVEKDNGSVTVAGAIRDKDGGVTMVSKTVTVNNVAPELGAISGPLAPVAMGTTVNVSALFTDAGILDTHTAAIDWEGATSVGLVDATSRKISGSHAYSAAGVYRVKITLTDKDGGVDAEIFEYVVVYDPSAGFVTGGGWINSPAGALTADPTLTGKATFGFVSKYLKGAVKPSGNTEFQFHAGNLNFKSTDYEWLVVSGSKAQYKGTGTINGVSGYDFLLTVTDGSPDKFRMRITSAAGVVYDNVGGSTKLSESDTQAIGGGSIVIHSSK